MAYRANLSIAPTTLTDLKITVIDNTAFSKIYTLADCTISDYIECEIDYTNSSTTANIYSPGYQVENIVLANYDGSVINLTPISDYSKTSDGTNTYYVKDNYERSLANDIYNITQAQLALKEDINNKVTSLSSSSTNIQYPSAKCVYDELALKQDTLTFNSPLYYNSTTKVLSLPYKAPISTNVTYTNASNILVNSSGYIALNSSAYSTSPASRQTCTFSGNTATFNKETLTQVTTDGTGSWIVRDYTPEVGDVITITPYDYQTNQGRLGIILGKLISGTFYPCFAVSYGYSRTNGYICPYSLKSGYTPEQAYSACSTGNSYNFGDTTYWDAPNMNASFSATSIRVTSDLQIRLLANGTGIRPQLFAPTNNEPSGATGSTYYDLPDGINAIMFVGISASNSDTTIDTSTTGGYVPYVLAGGVKDSNNNTKVDIRYSSMTIPALALNYGNGLIVEDNTLKANLYSSTGSNTDGAMTQGATTDALNGKADTDLTNVTDAGKILISRMSMPSSIRYNLTIPASQSTVTATHDGWAVFVYRTATDGGFVGLGNMTCQIWSYASQSANNQLGRVYVPVSKGDIIRVEYTNSSTTTTANALYIMRALGGE